MPAPLSVIIPTLNSAPSLGPTVRALFEGVQTGLVRELIISDGGSNDEITQIAKELGAHLISGPPGRGNQLARGAAVAKGEWLLFLHADTHLKTPWVKEVYHHIANFPQLAAYFRLEFRAKGLAPKLVAIWANFRSRWLGLPYGDQGLLISRAVYDNCGGYPDIPLMEDVAMAQALSKQICQLDAVAQTSAAKYLHDGWIRRGSRNFGILLRYKLGADSVDLAKRYYQSIASKR